jgi:DnaJ-class molecular chaperone
MKDYYLVLKISKDASTNDIKKQYRNLAKHYHPDKNKSADAQEKFVEISEAYSILSDPIKRAQYDNQGNNIFNTHHIDIHHATSMFNSIIEEMNKFHNSFFPNPLFIDPFFDNPFITTSFTNPPHGRDIASIPTYENRNGHNSNQDYSFSSFSTSSTNRNGITTTKHTYHTDNNGEQNSYHRESYIDADGTKHTISQNDNKKKKRYKFIK